MPMSFASALAHRSAAACGLAARPSLAALLTACQPAVRSAAISTLLVGLVGLSAPRTAHADSHAAPALSLESALQQAQARSQGLLAQEAAALAARELATAAGQRPDPVLTLGVNSLPVDGPKRGSLTGDFMTTRSIGLMQELTREDKRSARAARFDAEAEVALARRAMTLVDLRRNTALAWLDLHFQQQMLAQMQAQRSEAELQVQGADAALRGGGGSQADTVAARAARALLDDRILQARIEVDSAQLQLGRWLVPASPMRLAPPPLLDRLTWNSGALAARIEQHPQIVLLSRRIASAQADVDIARTQQRSDWTVEVMYGQRGSAYSNMLSLNLRLPLQSNAELRQDRQLAAQQALQAGLLAEREEATRVELAAAQDLLQRWQQQGLRVAAYDRELMPLADDGVQVALAAYRGGSGTLAAALQARLQLLQTQLQRTRLARDAALLWARLEYLLPPPTASMATSTLDAASPPPAGLLSKPVLASQEKPQ